MSDSSYGVGRGSSPMCIGNNIPITVKSRCSGHFPTPPKDLRQIEHATEVRLDPKIQQQACVIRANVQYNDTLNVGVLLLVE
jgi:hypothetical protein